MTEQPAPPTGLPGELVDSLETCSLEQLRQVATYAAELATYRAEDIAETAAEPEADRPDTVPAKASITVKEINNNRYYYWQWRDGEHVRSVYKGPVNPGN